MKAGEEIMKSVIYLHSMSINLTYSYSSYASRSYQQPALNEYIFSRPPWLGDNRYRLVLQT